MNVPKVSTNLQQHEEINQLINEICISVDKGDLAQLQKNISQLKPLLNAFEQAPRTLDEHLTEYTEQISAAYFTAKELEKDDNLLVVSRQICEQLADLVYVLAKVRGYKFVANQLSNDVYLVPKLVKLIEEVGITQNHSEVYFLLLWLSRLVLVPFPLASVHLGIDRSIYNIALKYLALHSTASKIQVVSSVLLASLLARPDCSDLFFEYTETVLLDWSIMSNEKEKLGHLMTLNQILKKSMGGVVFDLVEQMNEDIILYEISQIRFGESGSINTFNALYLIKITSKMCKFYIIKKQFARVASLINSINDLMHYMGDMFDAALRECMAKNLAKTVSFLQLKAVNYASQLVAYMLGQLRILGLKDHVDFWPNLSIEASDLSVPRYHTVLLFLGFLALTKKLPVEYVPTVFSIIHKTCFVSQRNFSFVQTAQLRDASCFCAWALFRMLSAKQFSELADSSPQLVPVIFLDLVHVSIFDEDFTMRRCGIAVLQEMVGRFGTSFFPSMLCDQDASQIGEFTICFVEQFGASTVGSLSDSHEIIHVLTKMGFSFKLFVQPLVDEILADFSSFDLQKLGSRHLARMSAKIELVRVDISSTSPADISSAVDSLVDSLKRGNLNMLYALAELESRKLLKAAQRDAVFSILQDLKLLRSSLSTNSGEAIMHWLNSLEKTCEHHAELTPLVVSIQKLNANESLVSEFETYFKSVPDMGDETFKNIFRDIRMGNKLLASSISVANLNTEQRLQVYNILKDKTVDAEVRASILTKMDDSWGQYKGRLSFVPILMNLLDDYTISEQGDVGSKVRLACIDFIGRNSQMLSEFKLPLGSKLLRISGETIDRLRVSAFQVFCRIHDLEIDTDHMVKYNSDYGLYFSDLLKLYSELSMTSDPESQYHDAFWSGLVHSAGASTGTSTMINLSFRQILDFIRCPENLQNTISILLRLLKIPPGIKVSKLDSRTQKTLASTLGLLVKLFDAGVDFPQPIQYDSLFVRAYNLHINTTAISRVALVTRLFQHISMAQNTSHSLKLKCRKRLCWLASQHPNGQIRGVAADSLFEIANEIVPYHSIIPTLESYECNLQLANPAAIDELESVFLAI